MDKANLRSQMIDRRSRLTARDVVVMSRLITDRLINTIDWRAVRRLHMYESKQEWNEVKTDDLLQFLHAQHPEIAIVTIPPLKTARIPNERFDVIVVPLLAFDEHCNRLGFGGGWYDRFLATQPGAMTVGLAYDFQLRRELSVEPHDVRLTAVFTETRTYS